MSDKQALAYRSDHQALMIALLVFVSGATNAAIVPFMGFYIIEVLGHAPATVGLYSVSAMTISILSSRLYGEWVDGGARIRPLLFVCAFGAFCAAAAALAGSLPLLILITAPGMGLTNAASTLVFSYGRHYGRTHGLEPVGYNAFLRMTVSLAWMVMPAAAYLVADFAGARFVFVNAMLIVLIWVAIAVAVIPRGQTCPMERRAEAEPEGRNLGLWLAAAISFFLSFAHSLCASALPVFFVREAGLPAFAPGLSLSVKCAMEVFFILMAPRMARFISPRLILGGATILAVLAFNVIASVETVPQMLIGAAMEGTYYGLFAGTCLTFVQSFSRGRLARATALYMNSIFLAGIFSVPAMGLIAQLNGFGMAIRLASFGAGAAFLLLFLTRRQKSDNIDGV
ncbi:MFS transporter permease [Xaviernesmea oryzae]|uniref:MFS transporter permease n=1 Tax=Xaviernesmea oryzae TaxID=464029 RepID=A0A1Q9AZ82_9HYPH|nr:MFS transporter [Xaviernesmea oryzae]OLP61000.1 MFS transporter permease [Xaviernesmea oryzae]SEL17918.1 MFS transporter, SET family, sugar efflux transporter [Xaviernesmea oryzae]